MRIGNRGSPAKRSKPVVVVVVVVVLCFFFKSCQNLGFLERA
jgi:hypothetical protein